MKNIKGKIWWADRTLLMQIEQMNSDFISEFCTGRQTLNVSLGSVVCNVRSSSIPELPNNVRDCVLHVYGDSSSRDKSVVQKTFDKKQDASKIFDITAECFKKINNTLSSDNGRFRKISPEHICRPITEILKYNNFSVQYAIFNQIFMWQFIKLKSKMFEFNETAIEMPGAKADSPFSAIVKSTGKQVKIYVNSTGSMIIPSKISDCDAICVYDIFHGSSYDRISKITNKLRNLKNSFDLYNDTLNSSGRDLGDEIEFKNKLFQIREVSF